MIPFKRRYRLSIELSRIMKIFKQFKLYQTTEEIYFMGWYFTTTGTKYLLKLIISENYPDEMPKLYVVCPKILWQYGGMATINNIEFSHAFHTNSNDTQGNIQICHYSSESWHAGCTCVEVLKKGQIWCEAHAEHCSTGRSIDAIISSWKKSKEKQNTAGINWSELLISYQAVPTLDIGSLSMEGLKKDHILFDEKEYLIPLYFQD